MKKNKKLLILVNDLSFFISHRLPIAEAALTEGFEVVIGYGEQGNTDPKLLEKKGFKINFIPMYRGSINPLKNLITFFYIWNFFKKEKPDIVHLITIKPYLYGGVICRLTNIPGVVSAVSGLGTLFISKNLKVKFLLLLLYPIYKLAFNHKNQIVIVQNEDDLKELVNWGVLNVSKTKLLRGSGIDLKKFSNFEEPKGTPIVCFAARLLKDKGVYEFVSAARLLKKQNFQVRFWLAGSLDSNNPAGLNNSDLKTLKEEGCVEILGYQKDIPKLYANSHIICLPSYREGLPKSLIEAAAASRSIVTTDVPGCREAIIPNKTGLLVPVKDFQKLTEAIRWLIEHPQERIAMGKEGRKYAEKEFPIEKIVQNHMNIYNEILSLGLKKN
ncbi:glycosyltransferase family 4 protein [Candidatus Pelagibacter bacterium]|nr:glycosyltransferase family 4 protein [Candidatus Pelagibacter bacterium]